VATFKAVLQPDPTGTGTFVVVPRKLNDELGLKDDPRSTPSSWQSLRESLSRHGDGFLPGRAQSQELAGV